MTKKTRLGRPPTGRAKTAWVQIKCRPEWRDYLRVFATDRGTDISGIVDEATRWYAAHLRRQPPPER
jgi:hypothetical protein